MTTNHTPSTLSRSTYFYGKRLDDIDAAKKDEHGVHHLDLALKFFAAGRLDECRAVCEEIVGMDEEGKSKTVRAKAYMLLARPEVEMWPWKRV